MKAGQMLYRNPEGHIEFKELTDKVGKIHTFDADRNLVVKEFADTQLSLLRIADPILTNVSQGYKNPMLVGDVLFPSLKMQKETGRFPAWGEDVFIVPTNLKRGIGEKVQRVNAQPGYILATLSEYAEGFGVDNRQLNEYAGTPDQYLTHMQGLVMRHILNVRESNQATLATLYTNYASGCYTTGASFDWAGSGTPLSDFETGKQAIEAQIGISPNVAWFTPTAWKLFKNNENVLSRIRYQGTQAAPAQVFEQTVAELLGVSKVIVARAVTGSEAPANRRSPNQGGLTSKGFLWEKVNSGTYAACAGLAYVGVGQDEPSFGYTYERMNSPIVESYYDNATKQQVYDAEHFFDAAITLNKAGYLMYSIA